MKLNKKYMKNLRVEVATKGCEGCIFNDKKRRDCLKARTIAHVEKFIECTDGFIYVKGKRT